MVEKNMNNETELDRAADEIDEVAVREAVFTKFQKGKPLTDEELDELDEILLSRPPEPSAKWQEPVTKSRGAVTRKRPIPAPVSGKGSKAKWLPMTEKRADELLTKVNLARGAENPLPPAPKHLVRWFLRADAGSNKVRAWSMLYRVKRAGPTTWEPVVVQKENTLGTDPSISKSGLVEWKDQRVVSYYTGDNPPGTLLVCEIFADAREIRCAAQVYRTPQRRVAIVFKVQAGQSVELKPDEQQLTGSGLVVFEWCENLDAVLKQQYPEGLVGSEYAAEEREAAKLLPAATDPWLEQLRTLSDSAVDGRLTSAQVREAVGLPVGGKAGKEARRAGRVMRYLGWRSAPVSVDGNVTSGWVRD